MSLKRYRNEMVKMNYKQINEMEVGDWFEFIEGYVYDTEFGILISIPKGTWMKFHSLSIRTWHFTFHKREGLILRQIGFGRSRLLKLKLKKINIEDNRSRALRHIWNWTPIDELGKHYRRN